MSFRRQFTLYASIQFFDELSTLCQTYIGRTADHSLLRDLEASLRTFITRAIDEGRITYRHGARYRGELQAVVTLNPYSINGIALKWTDGSLPVTLTVENPPAGSRAHETLQSETRTLPEWGRDFQMGYLDLLQSIEDANVQIFAPVRTPPPVSTRTPFEFKTQTVAAPTVPPPAKPSIPVTTFTRLLNLDDDEDP